MRPLAATATLHALLASRRCACRARTLTATFGISEDAGYDAINDAYDELSERYAGDAGMITKLDAAKDKVVNNMLAKAKMGGRGGVLRGLARGGGPEGAAKDADLGDCQPISGSASSSRQSQRTRRVWSV